MKNKLFLRLKDLVQKENRARLAVLLGAAAMLLLLLSELFTPSEKPAAASAAPADESAYRQQLEQQLSDLIAQVEGAGRTTVMITLESGEETIYALDTLSGQTQQQQTHVPVSYTHLHRLERRHCLRCYGCAAAGEGI